MIRTNRHFDPRAIRFLIFDLDGTLIDSRLDLIHSINAMLRHCGRPELPGDVIAAYVGDGAPMLVRRALGDPEDEMTNMGPLAQRTAVDWVESQINQAVSRGAKVMAGGRRLPGPGYYYQPAVLVDVDHTMSVMMDESFGPVIGIMPVDSEDEAVRLMNDSPYGLTASIWTEDTERGEALAHRLAAGTVYVNRCDYLDPELAWTGIKDSGHGCTLSHLGFLYLTRPKSFHVRTRTGR